MLSYLHGFHAGNHADMLKHVVLLGILARLTVKDAPLRYIETHAGAGGYDLRAPEAQKNREHETGIAKLWPRRDPPARAAALLELVERYNGGRAALERYPGSPWLALATLRAGDSAYLFELHPTEHRTLSQAFAGRRNVTVLKQDGLEGCIGLVPPPERRGLVLIDPAYERRDEFDRVLAMLPALIARWPNGVYAVWYPLLRKPEARAFVRQLRALEMPRPFQVELQVAPAGSFGLFGSGLVIANLPYGLDAQLKTLMPWLHRRLAPEGVGSWQARPLAP